MLPGLAKKAGKKGKIDAYVNVEFDNEEIKTRFRTVEGDRKDLNVSWNEELWYVDINYCRANISHAIVFFALKIYSQRI